jgi:hypothetical protein
MNTAAYRQILKEMGRIAGDGALKNDAVSSMVFLYVRKNASQSGHWTKCFSNAARTGGVSEPAT